ncbi:RHS repeat domain-containing protein, partial [Rhodopirellula sp. JC639]|uniref:RHS repeat domain-containing protein n=1 Tax=Stieleria mannarensis TaxID=2755585 RepID=UPI0015FF93BF
KPCTDSKQRRSCKTLRHPTCSLGKSRTESEASCIKLGFRYVRTQQYSINALTDSSGAIKERYAYDAYGNLSIFDASGTARTSTAEGNRYTYTGREYDDVLDLYHYRARMYDPIAGRFCSRDPIGYEDGKSLYRQYFLLANTDPYGTIVERIEQQVLGSPSCNSCGNYDSKFEIKITPNPLMKGVTRQHLVQKLCYDLTLTNCFGLDSNESGCCQKGAPGNRKCCVYEYFGAVETSPSGVKFTDHRGKPNDRILDRRFAQRGQPTTSCGNIGVDRVSSEFRLFSPSKEIEDFLELLPFALDDEGHTETKICTGESLKWNGGWKSKPAFWDRDSQGSSAIASTAHRWDCCGPGGTNRHSSCDISTSVNGEGWKQW